MRTQRLSECTNEPFPRTGNRTSDRGVNDYFDGPKSKKKKKTNNYKHAYIRPAADGKNASGLSRRSKRNTICTATRVTRRNFPCPSPAETRVRVGTILTFDTRDDGCRNRAGPSVIYKTSVSRLLFVSEPLQDLNRLTEPPFFLIITATQIAYKIVYQKY